VTSSKYKKIALTALKSIPGCFVPDVKESTALRDDFDILFDDLGMDSLAKMELSIWLEIEYGIELNEDELENLKSLNGLTDYLIKNVKD
jgi:acyl carrier protein